MTSSGRQTKNTFKSNKVFQKKCMKKLILMHAQVALPQFSIT